MSSQQNPSANGSTRKAITINNNPGPGAYELNPSIFQKSGGQLIGTSKRQDFMKLVGNQPSPGKYLPSVALIKRSVANWGISKTSRESDDTRNKVIMPGPGSYQVKMDQLSENRSSPKIQIAQKFARKSINTNPGPVDYEPAMDTVKNKAPAFRMGTDMQRVPLAVKAQLESPGPNQYF